MTSKRNLLKDFKIISRLGKGAFANVFLVEKKQVDIIDDDTGTFLTYNDDVGVNYSAFRYNCFALKKSVKWARSSLQISSLNYVFPGMKNGSLVILTILKRRIFLFLENIWFIFL